MFKIILTILKFIFGTIILIVVTSAISIAFFTYKYPESTIALIQQHLVPKPEIKKISIKAIGVLGDSQSDEYRADDNRGDNYPSTTLNWVEILSDKRDINFGEWGVWAEPRRRGFDYNWARTGATAASMIESGQHIGLAEQVQNGNVNVVIIYIGANDFSPYITSDGYEAIYSEQLTDAQIERKINRFVADVTTAVDVIQQAGDVQIFLVKVPDWGNHIGVKLAFPLPYKRQLVRNVINKTNTELQKVADERGIPTLDPNTFLNNLDKESVSAKPVLDNVTLEYLHLNNNPENVFLKDGVHTGTAINGLFANYIINTINPYLETEIKPLTNEEIKDVAGL